MSDGAPKPHPLVFGPIKGMSTLTLLASLDGLYLDVAGLYEHCDAVYLGAEPDPRPRGPSELTGATQLIRWLVAEIHRLDGLVPEDERLNRCPICACPSWSRPLLDKAKRKALFPKGAHYDFTRRACSCCHHVRPEHTPEQP